MAKTGMPILDPLPERVETIERKLDALAVSVDRRFDEVSEAIAEQRRYTEFACGRLEEKMTVGFAQITVGLETMTANVTRLGEMVALNTSRIEGIDHKLDRLIAAQGPPRSRTPRRRK